jgi:peptidoglycan/xylan/chitin deacetylase (PgdA/CDA1 family)
MLCLRFDVDTLRDCEALPLVLAILRRHSAKATFFIATGYDRTGLNLTSYLRNPRKLGGKKLRHRYGIKNLLLSMVSPERIETKVDFREIRRDGNEVSLHGYEHYTWIKNFGKMGIEDIRRRILAGIAAFEKASGLKPVGFASPGFKVNDSLLTALEDFGFKYSSDFMGDGPFYPVLGGEKLRTLQIPVLIDVEELVGKLGAGGYLTYLRKIMRRRTVVAYLHPSYAYINAEVIDNTLRLAKDGFATLGEVANENTAHL